MPAIEPELQALKDNLLDMLSLVKNQMIKCREAIEKKDVSPAEEVMDDERKVNIQELAIDRDCESILALYTPVATDLRLVLATLKITNDLERIGDNAKSLAKFLLSNINKESQSWINEFHVSEMLSIIITMLNEMGEALQKEDSRLALQSTKKDEHLNEYNKKAFKTAASLIKSNPDEAKTLLTLFALVRDLERAGDLTKNIAEEIVFHLDARVVKHKKDQKN